MLCTKLAANNVWVKFENIPPNIIYTWLNTVFIQAVLSVNSLNSQSSPLPFNSQKSGIE